MTEFDKSVRRRTVVQGMAWSVPAVVAASQLPAFAASACIDEAESWGGNFSAKHVQATRVPLPGTQITKDSFYAGSLDGEILNAGKYPAIFRQYPWVKNLAVVAQNGDTSQGTLLKIKFPQPAYCVEFLLHDIDSKHSGPRDRHQDSVTVTAKNGVVNATVFNQEHLRVLNNGSSSVTVESPHVINSLFSKQYDWDMYTETKGTAAISIVGPITELCMHFKDVTPGLDTGSRHNYQQIAVSNIKYSINKCDC
ncbi:hypothetical protein [uncultured Tessaracoccus sp.]|uniref:hypothetical protein n=1 Tax=uncultured Tessaracoccus sp. TaxID=905023 RepID=UPI0026063225|nr:hypothetical protein [uncultured Tessaracoccus sp.]